MQILRDAWICNDLLLCSTNQPELQYLGFVLILAAFIFREATLWPHLHTNLTRHQRSIHINFNNIGLSVKKVWCKLVIENNLTPTSTATFGSYDSAKSIRKLSHDWIGNFGLTLIEVHDLETHSALCLVSLVHTTQAPLHKKPTCFLRTSNFVEPPGGPQWEHPKTGSGPILEPLKFPFAKALSPAPRQSSHRQNRPPWRERPKKKWWGGRVY